MTISVLVDVEATGQSPFSGEMTEFGAVAMNREMTAMQSSFHGILIEAIPDPVIPAKPLILPDSKRHDEREVMLKFEKWLLSFGERVVFWSDNNGFDSAWINYYFDKHGIQNPFGHSSRRISDFYAGLTGNVKNTQKWKKLRVIPHTHVSLEDSLGNCNALISLIAMSRGERPLDF